MSSRHLLSSLTSTPSTVAEAANNLWIPSSKRRCTDYLLEVSRCVSPGEEALSLSPRHPPRSLEGDQASLAPSPHFLITQQHPRRLLT